MSSWERARSGGGGGGGPGHQTAAVDSASVHHANSRQRVDAPPSKSAKMDSGRFDEAVSTIQKVWSESEKNRRQLEKMREQVADAHARKLDLERAAARQDHR